MICGLHSTFVALKASLVSPLKGDCPLGEATAVQTDPPTLGEPVAEPDALTLRLRFHHVTSSTRVFASERFCWVPSVG